MRLRRMSFLDLILCSAVRCGALRCGAMRRDATWYDKIRYHVIWYIQILSSFKPSAKPSVRQELFFIHRHLFCRVSLVSVVSFNISVAIWRHWNCPMKSNKISQHLERQSVALSSRFKKNVLACAFYYTLALSIFNPRSTAWTLIRESIRIKAIENSRWNISIDYRRHCNPNKYISEATKMGCVEDSSIHSHVTHWNWTI